MSTSTTRLQAIRAELDIIAARLADLERQRQRLIAQRDRMKAGDQPMARIIVTAAADLREPPQSATIAGEPAA